MKNSGIDIIIPVYNALEDLKKCIQSLLRHTDLTANRIVLIDDQSPDPAVYPYLQSITQPGIEVLQNEKNLGFSGTINRGLRYSCRDVVLLNTDTVVTNRWLEKMTACAYSDPSIGTVTPFSNNATLCSIPDFCQENTVPYGLSIDEYASIIEDCSLKKYPRITVAVGFCMFIKREVINRVGFFDAETFQKGYGEENDFCWRAEQLGYHHVLCDDTYIYHSGTASFLSKEKQQLIADHEQILAERYPRQLQRNSEYVRDNPHQYLRDNVDIHAAIRNGKRNILYVLHTDFSADVKGNIGGTQFHVKDLMNHLREENNIFVLARDGEILRLTAYLQDKQTLFKFRLGKEPQFQSFRSEAFAKIYRQILSAFAIDMVHVHHIQGLTFDVFTETKAASLPLVLTLHDYYYICPTIKLLREGSCYCGGSTEYCAACLRKQLGYAEQTGFITAWRQQCRDAMAVCDVIVTPSAAAKDVYASVYPDLAEKIRVIGHGMDDLARGVKTAPAEKKSRPRIAFLGGLNEEKGSRIAYELIRQRSSAYDWYIIGGVRDPDLYALERGNLHKTDWYTRENVCDLLRGNQIDLVCIFSIWPETFCYTLSEAEIAGIPVLAADIGALGERIREEGTGWLVMPDMPPKDIQQRIDEIFADTAGYAQVQNRLASFRHKTLSQQAAEYADLYSALPAAEKSRRPFDAQLIYGAYAMGRGGASGGDGDLIQRMNELEGRLLGVERSMAYKLSNLIRKQNFPGKGLAKKMARFAYRAYKKLRRKK